MFTSRVRTKQAGSQSERRRRFYDFLRENPIGVLSTVTPDGDPHGVVIYYAIDKNLVVSFLTRALTRKRDNLRFNDHVMLTVFEPRAQATVQIVGEAEEVAGSHEINGIAGAILGASLQTSDSGLTPVTKLMAGPYVGFRIVPKQMRMAVYGRIDPGTYGDLFESIESFDLHDDY